MMRRYFERNPGAQTQAVAPNRFRAQAGRRHADDAIAGNQILHLTTNAHNFAGEIVTEPSQVTRIARVHAQRLHEVAERSTYIDLVSVFVHVEESVVVQLLRAAKLEFTISRSKPCLDVIVFGFDIVRMKSTEVISEDKAVIDGWCECITCPLASTNCSLPFIDHGAGRSTPWRAPARSL